LPTLCTTASAYFFVAAKKAALDVVESRLESISIGPFCLELPRLAAKIPSFTQIMLSARFSSSLIQNDNIFICQVLLPMPDLKQQILELLAQVKGSGTFLSTGSQPFVFPGIQVTGVPEISFPVTTSQVKALIARSHKAPFGKGSKTVVDPTVRSTWDIDAGEISFHNKVWQTLLDNIISQVQVDLGDYYSQRNRQSLQIIDL